MCYNGAVQTGPPLTTEVNYEPPTDEQTASREDLQSRDLEDEKINTAPTPQADWISGSSSALLSPTNAHQVAPEATHVPGKPDRGI